MLEHLTIEVKEVAEEGSFAGYGAIFNNVDLDGDRIAPGAFTKSLARIGKSGAMPPILWGHNPGDVIGVTTAMSEDALGLKMSAMLVLEVGRAREGHALLKAGAIRGLSIGYVTVKAGKDGNVRVLEELDLWEVSLTPFPANPKAMVQAVKTATPITDFARRLRDGEPPSIKEFEDILREAGVPKVLAQQIASVGYAKAIRSESEGKASEQAIRDLRDAVMAFTPRT